MIPPLGFYVVFMWSCFNPTETRNNRMWFEKEEQAQSWADDMNRNGGSWTQGHKSEKQRCKVKALVIRESK